MILREMTLAMIALIISPGRKTKAEVAVASHGAAAINDKYVTTERLMTSTPKRT